MKNLFNFFSKSKDVSASKPLIDTNSDTYIDSIICLNKNYEIDVKLFFDDNLKNKTISENEYALVCAEFLHIIMSGKLKNQLLDIIVNQIKNTKNQDLIDRILKLLIIMEEFTSEEDDKDNTPLIKPSQVFSKYKNG